MYVYSNNEYHQTTDVVQSKLDFTGRVLETTTSHVKANDASLGTQSIVDKFTYDHAGRLLTQKQYLNGDTTGEMIALLLTRRLYKDVSLIRELVRN